MYIIWYRDDPQKAALDIYPGCWNDPKTSFNLPNIKEGLMEILCENPRIVCIAYCLDHECENNNYYKPPWLP